MRTGKGVVVTMGARVVCVIGERAVNAETTENVATDRSASMPCARPLSTALGTGPRVRVRAPTARRPTIEPATRQTEATETVLVTAISKRVRALRAARGSRAVETGSARVVGATMVAARRRATAQETTIVRGGTAMHVHMASRVITNGASECETF